MFFTNPTYLWALTGLIIPLAIHLWSKKEGKVILMGSIKHLPDANPKQTSNIKLNEYALLLLRMLIIGLLAIMLAGPSLVTSKGKREKTIYLVEPSLLTASVNHKPWDSVPSQNVRLLSKDFPLLEETETPYNDEVPDYWQLAQDARNLNADSIVVFTNAFLSGIKGKRPGISTNMNWVVIDPCEKEMLPVHAEKKESVVEVLYMTTDCHVTTFERRSFAMTATEIEINEKGDSLKVQHESRFVQIPLKKSEPFKVLIATDAAMTADAGYVEAAFKAIAAFKNLMIEVIVSEASATDLSDDVGLLVWLAESPLPETEASVLQFKEDPLAIDLVVSTGISGQFWLTSHLNPENVFERHLAESLLSTILPVETKIDKLKDRRVISYKELLPERAEGNLPKKETAAVKALNWFWYVLLLLLLGERVLAYYRKQ